jgi:hypothetical protein
MAATKNVPLVEETGDRNLIPVASTKRLFEGAMAFLDASGYATPTPGSVFAGHVVAEADNRTGGNAAKSVNLRYGRYCAQVALPSVAITDVGGPVYATDDNTYALTGTYQVGKVKRYVSANVAVVEFISPEIAPEVSA